MKIEHDGAASTWQERFKNPAAGWISLIISSRRWPGVSYRRYKNIMKARTAKRIWHSIELRKRGRRRLGREANNQRAAVSPRCRRFRFFRNPQDGEKMGEKRIRNNAVKDITVPKSEAKGNTSDRLSAICPIYGSTCLHWLYPLVDSLGQFKYTS